MMFEKSGSRTSTGNGFSMTGVFGQGIFIGGFDEGNDERLNGIE